MINEGMRVFVLKTFVPGRGRQVRRIGRPMPADRAAELFMRITGDPPSIGPAVMLECEATRDGVPGSSLCARVAGGGYLRAQRPDAPLV